MGAGSGIGRAGVAGLAAPPNPMIGSGMGMGMPMGNLGMGMGGYGRGINQPMGMGMGMGMGMNMGIGPGALPPGGMPSSQAIRGIGYNPMAGMGGYGSQQYGGYRWGSSPIGTVHGVKRGRWQQGTSAEALLEPCMLPILFCFPFGWAIVAYRSCTVICVDSFASTTAFVVSNMGAFWPLPGCTGVIFSGLMRAASSSFS